MSILNDPVCLAQKLIALDTTNPPGCERECAHFIGSLLLQAGFEVHYHEFAQQRTSVIARYLADPARAPICFSGHIDTVPAGEEPWVYPPLEGVIVDGKLYGRGSSDMKAGVAAMLTAAVRTVRQGGLKAGLSLVLTAGEEAACEGARHLAKEPELLGPAGALVIGEPTSNQPIIAEKGILWLRLAAKGVAAHGSMPEQGENAIYRAAHAIKALQSFSFDCSPHAILGSPTLNVGCITGGSKFNIVPDKAVMEVDVRLVPGQTPDSVVRRVAAAVGPEVDIEVILSCPALEADPADPWLRRAEAMFSWRLSSASKELGVPYFTDAAYLSPAFGGVPCLILGPGEPSLAHKVNEYCLVPRILEAAECYRQLAADWCTR